MSSTTSDNFRPAHLLVLYYNRRHHPLLIRWARAHLGCRVTAVAIDLGELREREAIGADSLAAGAEDFRYVDGRAEFCDDFLARAIKANARYQDKYLLSAALARPMLARKLVQLARELGAGGVVHGFRGNDQVRLDMALGVLSDLRSVAGLRSWGVADEEIRRYAQAHDIPDEPGTGNPYSVSENLWGKSTECGPLGDPAAPPPEEIFRYVRPPGKAPDEAARVRVGFEAGVPCALDGAPAALVDILSRLNQLGALHGVGVADMVEDGMVGLKSRAVYENPGARCLLEAHQDLERFVCNRHENRFKPLVEHQWAQMVYDGLWFDPLMDHLHAFVDSMSRRVTGEVELRLYKGGVSVIGRRSPHSPYAEREAIYNFGHRFGTSAAEAFGHVFNLHSRAARAPLRRQP